ncbi:hypothetical protein HMPREF9306_01458 [Propionimicrobium lymphophilum ACS-093-V-SCH5]|uniref:Uncharacterized protein n=1 Tax=Propionimicrobium lymphophilum ACS-093-V-SCH5 TaxID=883161 RepID=S2WGY1_9ACTN|nr:hypothetical protein [Propionimicrobium lymphophilum]EPD31902.1 hypothetical protein HMPREF9306_01458 [Propionimicrobium lymphophilum ACS-093-V-SCH5]
MSEIELDPILISEKSLVIAVKALNGYVEKVHENPIFAKDEDYNIDIDTVSPEELLLHSELSDSREALACFTEALAVLLANRFDIVPVEFVPDFHATGHSEASHER